jgi:small subunit ribosomal protein S1
VGATVPVEILSVDSEKRRIGVALVPDGSTRATTAEASAELVPGKRITGKVERHERFGVFVFLGPGRVGLMPLSETGLEKDADIAKRFPIGGDVDVIVLDADADGHRIRVSHKAVADAEDAAELREYAARLDAAPSQGFASLADKLRGALRSKDRE